MTTFTKISDTEVEVLDIDPFSGQPTDCIYTIASLNQAIADIGTELSEIPHRDPDPRDPNYASLISRLDTELVYLQGVLVGVQNALDT
jgi:hypothetical protein